MGGVVVVVLLLLLAVPGWVPVLKAAGGDDRAASLPSTLPDPGVSPADAGLAQAEAAGIDVGQVIDNVAHRMVPDSSGALVSEDDAYHARFDAEGFEVALVGEDRGAIRVAASGLRRGATDLALAPGAWASDSNMATRALAPGVAERVSARGGELEWDVVLDRPLPGRGDLVVAADVGGLVGTPRAEDRVLRLPLEGGAIEMGELVVLDANGVERHRSLPRADGSTLRLEVPAAVLEGAAYPLTLDPIVSPEYPVSEPVTTRTSGFEAAVASGVTNSLVVWKDFRSGDGPDIYGARVGPTGTVLDPSGIRISSRGGAQTPAVAFDGTNYLVVWNQSTDIFGARVTSGGTVLDRTVMANSPGAASGIPINAAAGSQLAPAVAFDGTNYLVVWQGFNDPTRDDIFGARVTTDGTVLDGPVIGGVGTGIRISTAAGNERTPAVAFDGTNYLVVWEDNRSSNNDIYGARVKPDKTVLDATGIAISTAPGYQLAPAVAFDGANHLVVWHSNRLGFDDIYGARVKPDGTGLDGTEFTIAAAAGFQSDAAVAFDGTTYLVVWRDSRSGGQDDVYGARVAPGGTVLDLAGIAISTGAQSETFPAVAFDGTNYRVVWQDDRSSSGPENSRPEIFGARVSPAGSVVDAAGMLISTVANIQYNPAVAFDGTNYLVVWEDLRSGNEFDIYGARVSPTGSMLDGTGIRIATAAGNESAPAVAFDGTNYLVVWSDGRAGSFESDIYGTRIGRDGTVLDGTGTPVSIAPGGQFNPAVAFDGTNFLVVWQDARSSQLTDVYGARVSRTGDVLDAAGIAISSAADFQSEPAVAFDGTNYLVVWTDGRSGAGPTDIYGARVSAAGVVLDPTLPLTGGGIAISTGPSSQRNPAVASNGSRHLVVWADFRSGSNLDIYGARVSEQGMVESPSDIPISTAPGDQDVPAVAVNGPFQVVWRDRRSGTSLDIYTSRVTNAGAVQDRNGLAVATSPTDEDAPAVVASGNRFGIVYSRFAPVAPYGSDRVFLRTYTNTK